MNLEKLDILSLMEVKGGSLDSDIHCSPGTSAVTCTAPNSGVITNNPPPTTTPTTNTPSPGSTTIKVEIENGTKP